MPQRPLTDRQREALLILIRNVDGVDRDNKVQQGVWNSLRNRGLVIYRRPYHHLTEEGVRVAFALDQRQEVVGL